MAVSVTFPLLITNFKTYPSATGLKALELAKIHDKVARETGVCIAIAVQATDIRLIAGAVSIPVFAQHFDPFEPGKNTGLILPSSLKEAGARGSLLNHAERKLDNEVFVEAVARARELGLFIVFCATDAEEAAEIANFEPDCIAVEPPSLIGGDVSVSTAYPELITESVQAVPNLPVLVGAGVKNKADVVKALELGAKGVLLASGITQAADPEAVLRDLISGML